MRVACLGTAMRHGWRRAARAVQHVRFLGLPDAPETAVMQQQAAAHGYAVNPVQELENA